MIVWSGRGILSVLFWMFVALIFYNIIPKEHSDYAFVASSFITAACSWFFGNKWNNEHQRVFIDEATGQRFALKGGHTLFWIKMQYWGIIFAIIGIIVLAQNSVIAAVIATIVFLAACIGIILQKQQEIKEVSQQPSIQKKAVKNSPNTQPPLKTEEEPIETEEERSKRRREKEDPSRFMPK